MTSWSAPSSQALTNARIERAVCAADRAARIAERHDAAVQAGGGLRVMHEQVASLHRRVEARHRLLAEVIRLSAARSMRQAHPTDVVTQTLTTLVEIRGVGTAGAIIETEAGRCYVGSDAGATAACELELLAGEGPGTDSLRLGDQVFAQGDELRDRWWAYGPALHELGVTKVAASPVQFGGRRLGTLVLFSGDDAATPSPQGLTNWSTALGDVLVDAPAGTHHGLIDQVSLFHQAAGLVAVERDCSVADAAALLSAGAFTAGSSLKEYAQGIVDDHEQRLAS